MKDESAQQRAQRDVHVLVMDTMADWEPAFAVAHINRPAPGVTSRYRVRTVGLGRTSVRSMGGFAVTPDLALSELVPQDSAMLILPGAEAATAAGVRVVIESQDENDVWGTVGVSENIITASLQALADSMEYALLRK